ncbi:TRAUB-domain-containing protein [Meredithblackwellia eburnea MCA 4105]
MSKRLTLAEQLAEISKPAPVELDPEDDFHAGFSAERNKESEAKKDLDAARSEYVDVGTSKLRRKGEASLDNKYDGKKSSRKALYDDDSESGAGSGDDDAQDEGDFEDLEAIMNGGEEDFSDEDDDEEIEGNSDSDKDDDEEDEEGDSESASEDDEEEEAAPRSQIKKSAMSSKGGKSTTSEQDEKAMVSQLKQAASADVEKGRDVKKQLAFCDNIIESRIKLQKAVTAANALPQSQNAESFFALVPEEQTSALAELEALSEELFSLRKDLLDKEAEVKLSSSFGITRKRKRDAGGEEYLSASLADLASLEAALNPFLRTTVQKWSDKVLAASGLAITNSKKFNKASGAASSQNALAQIDHALSQGERERLVKRTRLRRDEEGPKTLGKMDVTLEGEKEKPDEEVFDDGDFYQQMLRDLVESRMLDLDDPTMASLRMASARGKKVKKVVDTRASKGRKIRYHVHEKVQNFMIPIDAGGWHEEQVDELFASLLGRTTTLAPAVAVGDDDEEAEGAEQKVEVGTLRLF